MKKIHPPSGVCVCVYKYLNGEKRRFVNLVQMLLNPCYPQAAKLCVFGVVKRGGNTFRLLEKRGNKKWQKKKM